MPPRTARRRRLAFASRFTVAPAALITALFPAPACDDRGDPCTTLCDQAVLVFQGCLDQWGIDWNAAGYEDAEDYRDACLTWAWEMHLLAADAGVPDQADDLCAERTQVLETGSCEAYLEIDWNVQPWL